MDEGWTEYDQTSYELEVFAFWLDPNRYCFYPIAFALGKPLVWAVLTLSVGILVALI